MRIAIGSDHAGFELKETVKAFLVAENREVLDVGTHGTNHRNLPRLKHAAQSSLKLLSSRRLVHQE
jgi:ribose 5-phosphate isomerase RpiB